MTPVQKVVKDLMQKRAETESPLVGKEARHCWYDLDWLLPYSDLLMVLGFGLIVAGVGHWSPLCRQLLVAGIGLVALSWRIGKSQ